MTPRAPLQLAIDQRRLTAELEQLAQFSDADPPAVTRVLFTDADGQARQYVVQLARDAGLTVRSDPVGNLFFRWQGADDQLPPIATGSHIDAIPQAGMYDGTVGVLGGLEAIRALQQSGQTPRRSIELIVFTSEEPTRFGIGCLGSRLLAGQLSPEEAGALTDEQGVSLDEARRTAGYEGPLAEVVCSAKAYAAFVELHIEQGPLLETHSAAIGVVEAIAAPASLRVDYAGPGGHAGALLMADRADPLLAGAELALDVEAAALATGVADAVATVGVLDVHPRAINSVPRRAMLQIDVRDIDGPRRDRTLQQIRDQAQQRGDRRGVKTTIELINADPPATCSTAIVAAVEQAAAEARLAAERLVSRAYHDALFMAQICPTGMIFIPCRDGVSHRPDEYASPEAIGQGVEVLARTLYALATDQ